MFASEGRTRKQAAMDFLQEFRTTNVDELEYEDDVFYSELRRRVLQVTEDDEDEEERVCGRKISDMAAAEKQRGYYDWPPNKEGIAAPASIMNLWRAGNGNGTGVFIPQIVQQSKKKNRSRRKRNERGRTYNRVERNW